MSASVKPALAPPPPLSLRSCRRPALASAHLTAQRFLCAALPLVLASFTPHAHATVISAGTYTLQNAYAAGYSITGTLTVNSLGDATAANLTFNDPNVANAALPSFSSVSLSSVYNGLSQNYIAGTGASGLLAVYFNTLADASGHFNLCLGSAQCGTSYGTVDPSTIQIYSFYNTASHTGNAGLGVTNLTGGYLVAANTPVTAATPEPSSLYLLGTGILGLAAFARNRRGQPRAA